MIVFVDTSVLVSIFNPLDTNNNKALQLARKYPEKYLISNYVFSETVTVLSQRVGREKAVYAGEKIKKDFQQIRVDEDLEDLAWEIFKKQMDKDISLVDCTIIALYQKQVFEKCFTFDSHFQKSKVPLLS